MKRKRKTRRSGASPNTTLSIPWKGCLTLSMIRLLLQIFLRILNTIGSHLIPTTWPEMSFEIEAASEQSLKDQLENFSQV